MLAKKSLGQNFLRDAKILKKIVDFAQIEKEDVVVEVGPGEGGLTKPLLDKARKVIAIEKDDELAEGLVDKFDLEIKAGKLEIVRGDILNHSPSTTNYKLVGNIPYYITGAIFKKFLESKNPPKSICFVTQKEVADRIVARDGKESILSISIKVFGNPEYGGLIKAGSFYPKPKVDSAIIAVRGISREKFFERASRVRRHEHEHEHEEIFSRKLSVQSEDDFSRLEKKFFEILKKGFAHKRKLLMKNLEVPKTVFDICGIGEKARAENLKVENWLCLANEI